MINRRYSIFFAAFASGAAVMMAEVAGLRLFAPTLGGSIAVSSSVIGSVLLGLAIGAWIGGQIIDRHCSIATITKCLCLAALLVSIVPSANDYSRNLFLAIEPIEVAALASALSLLFLPMLALGAICPMCIKVSASGQQSLGREVGLISFLATLGSITGTLGSGLVLLPLVGVKITFLCSAALLLIAAAALRSDRNVLLVVALIAAGYFLPGKESPSLVYKTDSIYSHIEVADGFEAEGIRKIRSLRTDPYTLQGAKYILPESPNNQETAKDPFTQTYARLSNPSEILPVPYTRFFRVGATLCGSKCKALLIGGGSYSYPEDFLASVPEGSIDVVELDPEITSVAKRFFNLKEQPRLKLINQDGRFFLNRTNNKYDLIILDVYAASQSIPAHLLSLEAFVAAKRLLNSDGLVMLNLLSSLAGPRAALHTSVRTTLKQIFPETLTFAVKNAHLKEQIQNLIILTGNRRNLREAIGQQAGLNIYSDKLLEPDTTEEGVVLRDDSLISEHYGLLLARELKRGYSGSN